MNFIWISPQFPKTYWNFCDRLKRKGIQVLGIGDAPYDELSSQLKDSLSEYYRVEHMDNYEEMFRAVAYYSFHYGKIDWLESNNEYWLEEDAHLRTDFNITSGMRLDVIHSIKSKSQMKEYYRRAGVVTARWQLVSTYEKACSFTKEVGYPIIVKPDIGVGADATFKIHNEVELKKFFDHLPHTPYIMEEYVEGLIVSYDGVANSQREVLYDTSHIFPTPIMDIVNDGDHMAYYTNRIIDEDIRNAGRRTVKAFPTNSRFFHFEFFRLTKDKEGLGRVGDIVGLEVNMRPPGGYTPDMMNFAGSMDIYQVYADMIAADKTNIDINKRDCYCVYASQRDGRSYTHSYEDILIQYGSAIKMAERMPDILSSAMGNLMFTACFDTLAEVEAFIAYVQEEKREQRSDGGYRNENRTS